MRVVGICSGGGHLTELKMITRHLPTLYAVVTEQKTAARNDDSGILYVPLIDPHRSPIKFIKNLISSCHLIYTLRPDVIVSTGAGMVVPFFLVGRLFGAKCIFIETGARITTPSITGRILYPFSHLFIVQNEFLKKIYKKAKVASILSGVR